MTSVRSTTTGARSFAMIALALATNALASACAMEPASDAVGDDDVAARSALSIKTVGTITAVVLPPTPPPPPPDCGNTTSEKTIRIPSWEFEGALQLALAGTRIVFDTTGTSPPLPGGEPFQVCKDPYEDARQEAIDACLAGPAQSKGVCLEMVKEDYPDMTECHMTIGSYHSYVDFSTGVENFGAEDMVFPDVKTIVRDITGPGTGSLTININNVNTTVNLTTLTAQFGPDQGCGTTAQFKLKLFSNNPTLKVEHSYLPAFPDVQLTDMVMDTQLCGLKPSDDGKQITFNGPDATFRFNKNLTNFPDWFVGIFSDIEAIIRNKVETKLEKALSKDTSMTALTSALTTVVKTMGQRHDAAWKDVEKFTKVRFENGDLIVSYVPVGALNLPQTACLPVVKVATTTAK